MSINAAQSLRKTEDNEVTAKFNAAALRVIEALRGDVQTGKCLCPVHADGRHPSLQVSNGRNYPVVIHCFGGGQNHDREVIDKLRQMRVWPTSANLSSSETSDKAEKKRSPKERLRYALHNWNGLKRSNGRRFAPVLLAYFSKRGLETVPPTALMTMPIVHSDSKIGSHDPGWSFHSETR